MAHYTTAASYTLLIYLKVTYLTVHFLDGSFIYFGVVFYPR